MQIFLEHKCVHFRQIPEIGNSHIKRKIQNGHSTDSCVIPSGFTSHQTYDMLQKYNVHATKLTLQLMAAAQPREGLAVGNYCQNENKPSIQFCQNGTISGSKVYINGSRVKTKDLLTEKGCICHLEQTGNKAIIVDAKESCFYCGLKIRLGNTYLISSYYGSTSYGWGSIILNDTKFTMTLILDESTGSLNTAFCIAIQENTANIPAVVTLTCEDPVMMHNTSFNASSTGPTLITSFPYMTLYTSKSQTPTSAGTAKPLTKSGTTGTEEISVKDTNGVQEPKTTNPSKVVTITAAQNNDIVVAAAAGGFGVGVMVVIVIDVIIFICYKRRKKIKDMLTSSTTTPREYTELEFNSRVGQSNSHIYKSIERQNTYVNDVE